MNKAQREGDVQTLSEENQQVLRQLSSHIPPILFKYDVKWGYYVVAAVDIAAAVGDSAKISVAGGVKADTAQQVKDAGASIIVAGAAIYGAADPAAAAAEITAIAH